MSRNTPARTPAKSPRAPKPGRAAKTLPKRPLSAAEQSRAAPLEIRQAAKRRPRRRAPKPATPEHYRNKLTIAIAPADYAWVTKLAAARNASVSSIFTEALHKLKRHTDLGALLELVGGTADITDEDRRETEAELRGLGLIP